MAEDNLNNIHLIGIDCSSREIYLHGFLGQSEEEPGIEYRMATTFVKNMNHLTKKDGDILIHMHTIGGNWHDGMAIYNTIEYSPCATAIIAYGSVSSMSSIILQSASTRLMMPDAEFMLHFGSTTVTGDSLAVISAMDNEKRINDRMLDIYTKRCIKGEFFRKQYKSLNKDKVKSFLTRKLKDKSDWYLSAEESVYYGFADDLIGSKKYKNIKEIRDS